MKTIGNWIRKATRQVFDPDREERIKELAALLYKNMQAAGDNFSLVSFKQQTDFYTDRDFEDATRRVYQTLLARAWKDDEITESERKTLSWVVARLHIPEREARQLQLSTARDRFAAALSKAMDDGVLDDEETAYLERITRSVGTTLGDFVRTYFQSEGEDFLRGVFAACTEGGVLADDAWTRLGIATKRLGLSKSDLLAAVRLQAERFVEHVLADAKSDGELSEDEEAVLRQLIRTLELNSESTNYVKKTIAALRTIRSARQGKLPILNRPPGVAIRSGEIVHCNTAATWLQKRVLKTGDHWDQHVGIMTITDNRILFSSDTRSFDIKFGKIASHAGATGVIRIHRLEKPEAIIRIVEDEPITYAILEGAIGLSNQTLLANRAEYQLITYPAKYVKEYGSGTVAVAQNAEQRITLSSTTSSLSQRAEATLTQMYSCFVADVI